MSNVIIVGAQWGDEGKGKIVDLLAEKADMVFYGYHPSIPGAPGHVALYVGNGRVLSLGSYPMRYLPVYYRSDLRGVRNYF